MICASLRDMLPLSHQHHMEGLVLDWIISSVLAMEILQSCTLICYHYYMCFPVRHAAIITSTPYGWLSTRLSYLQCAGNGDTAVLHFNLLLWCVSLCDMLPVSQQHHMDGLLQDCSISIANALGILQSGTQPLVWGVIHSIWSLVKKQHKIKFILSYLISQSTHSCPHSPERQLCMLELEYYYRQISNIRRTLVDNKFVDHSDVVGASPAGAAPTTSSFLT